MLVQNMSESVYVFFYDFSFHFIINLGFNFKIVFYFLFFKKKGTHIINLLIFFYFNFQGFNTVSVAKR
jgi:hypothetical protein